MTRESTALLSWFDDPLRLLSKLLLTLWLELPLGLFVLLGSSRVQSGGEVNIYPLSFA